MATFKRFIILKNDIKSQKINYSHKIHSALWKYVYFDSKILEIRILIQNLTINPNFGSNFVQIKFQKFFLALFESNLRFSFKNHVFK